MESGELRARFWRALFCEGPRNKSRRIKVLLRCITCEGIGGMKKTRCTVMTYYARQEAGTFNYVSVGAWLLKPSSARHVDATARVQVADMMTAKLAECSQHPRHRGPSGSRTRHLATCAPANRSAAFALVILQKGHFFVA